MTDRFEAGGLKVATELHDFIETQALPGTGIEPAAFWQAFGAFVQEFAPQNRRLVAKREDLQAEIDAWHKSRGRDYDVEDLRAFLAQIGYLVHEGPDFTVDTPNVDDEFAKIAGPQLVVPVMNARYALNAANARWGSLYDALYGTDAMGDAPPKGGYEKARGHRVVTWAKAHLKNFMRPAVKDWNAVRGFKVENGRLMATLDNDTTVEMTGEPPEGSRRNLGAFAGYRGDPSNPSAILLRKNNLHAELVIDRDHPIGKHDEAGIADVILEAAVTTIMDCEDSVAAVDAEDKVLTYANWLGLMKGDLEEQVEKGGDTITRSLNPDREYSLPDGGSFTLPGRSLMLVRNVGPLMTNPAILMENGQEIPEELMDGPITALCALHDIRKEQGPRNSRTGSVYIVKPKMHGPEEVAYTNAFMTRIEEMLGMERNTIKLGIMDEERRTTVNLKECIRAAKSRVAFINTGFLDRTGDEIHTAMQAGPMVRKTEMKGTAWIKAYEDWNVDIGLECGLKGVAQIGKGMWAMPDLMNDMLEIKIAHPAAGANTAWVPSPTAATLHATHYHKLNVQERQSEIAERERAELTDILTVPLARDTNWEPEAVQAELDNNAQGILGYVVRWVNAGVGCSKVPDINDVALMEDRATCRISSQHMANWLLHGVCTEEQVRETMKRMAEVVDRQNEHDPDYEPMAPGYDGPAFEAACRLVLEGVEQPSGYTEPILHEMRLKKKAEG